MTTNGDHRRRVFLGMPGYGTVCAGAARAFFMATAGGLAVRREYQEGSLLAANMNKLWAAALNDARKGRGPDYFAMQHADILAEDWWLDALVAELETAGLDVLGVVAPIKDVRGLTSTALARPDGYPWRPLARLTMAEVYRLPETFTAEDVGHPLLLNTGLWVCRCGEWMKEVHFTIRDRITQTPDGDYLAQVEPEDWFVSRRFHALGLKVGCTRKIKAGHQGTMIYSNHLAWGEWSHDEEAAAASVLPGPAGEEAVCYVTS